MIAASPCVFRPGANAEYVLVDGRTVAKVPFELAPALAAVLPLAGLTAWESLHERAKIEPQQTLLIHAGAGGVGHLAIQLAKASHCRVITTASRPESMDLCRKLGADLVIDYKETDFVSGAFDFTDGKGCDAVFDFVGEEVLNQSLDCVRVNGQVVTITPSRIFKDGYGLLLKNLTVHYEFMGVPTVHGVDIRSQGLKLQKLVDLTASGAINPHIGHTFFISELSQAHQCQESGASLGKILVSNAEWV